MKKRQPGCKLSEWPKSKTAVKMVDAGPIDDLGRRSFTLLWWRDGQPRAQCFFAKPGPHLKRMRASVKERAACS